MVFNLWRPIWLMNPRKSGWYQCTVAHGGGENIPKVMELYFQDWNENWLNPRRQNVFDGYKVYESGRAPIDEYRVYTDGECTREDVIAWRKLPRCYGWWRKKRNRK
nr:hypothetical protein [uncultured Mediterraneibacter sp.]